MSANRKIDERLLDIIRSEGAVDRKVLIDLLRMEVAHPDIETLINAYYVRLLNSIIAKDRDEKGNRNVLAYKDSNGVREAVNVLTCRDREKIRRLLNNIQRRLNGLKRTAAKISVALNQLCFFDENNQIRPEFIVKSAHN